MHCVRSSITVLRCGKGVQCVRIRTPITHVTCGSAFTRLIVDPGHHITTSGCQIRMIDDVIDKKEEPEVKWYPVVHEDNHKHHNEHLPTTANCEESILVHLTPFVPAYGDRVALMQFSERSQGKKNKSTLFTKMKRNFKQKKTLVRSLIVKQKKIHKECKTCPPSRKYKCS
ncbi:unnamed protein product [Mytilus edulis]|uniref:Uncharacterized protein n=1 Tax=Mytilus edulis TaxID=6550 RepID=A0A8S3T365_MYTED|nr:unnamed protein product [Mytilus edulis]